MVQLESLEGLPRAVLVELVKQLDEYDTDGEFVLKADGSRYRDPCTHDAVRLENMAIFQGSTIILDNNPLSIDWYMDEYPGRL